MLFAAPPATEVIMARDIVCDMVVNEDEAGRWGLISNYHNRSFYFCSRGCKNEFDQYPEHFACEKPPDRYGGPAAEIIQSPLT